MAGNHSKAIPRGDAPQYAYALAILSGGVAFIISQLGAPVAAAWLTYALLAAAFGFVWPRAALQWGAWLCLPIVLLIFFDVLMTWRVNALLSYGIMLGRALAASLLGAYAGSKLSTRGITNRAAHKHVRRRRSSGHHVALTPKVPAPQISASPDAGLMTLPASPVAGYLAAAAGHVANEEDLDAALIKAALEGDEERVRMLVAGGADLNAKGRAQWTPLVAGEAPAASGGDNTGMADALFGEGAVSAGDADGQGWTALMTATIEGHVEVVRVLLELGAEVDVESKKGWTALRFAVSMDEAGILRLLLAAGADANVADGEGATALMQAARENSEESLKALLGAGWGRGADPLLKDSRRRTALTIAQGLGHTNIVRLLKEAEAKAAGESPAPAFTYRVIKVPRDQGYGSAARYNAIPVGAVLPQGWEETGREGNEEECLYYAWRSNVDVQTESGVWLGYGNQSSA